MVAWVWGKVNRESGATGGRDYKRETFQSDGYDQHLDFGDGLRGIYILTYISKLTKLYT